MTETYQAFRLESQDSQSKTIIQDAIFGVMAIHSEIISGSEVGFKFKTVSPLQRKMHEKKINRERCSCDKMDVSARLVDIV